MHSTLYYNVRPDVYTVCQHMVSIFTYIRNILHYLCSVMSYGKLCSRIYIYTCSAALPENFSLLSTLDKRMSQPYAFQLWE